MQENPTQVTNAGTQPVKVMTNLIAIKITAWT